MSEPALGSLAYFNSEFRDFWEMMGNRSFWALTMEQRQKALEGLFRAGKDVPEADAVAGKMELAAEEFENRTALWITMSIGEV